jgi:single-strand DNA-binding protein
MPGGLNKVMVIGNVGRDPEMRYTPSGSAVTSFSVAVSRRWTTPDNQQREETEWFNVVAWDKLGEMCNQLITKGRKVYIEGRLQTRSWEAQDGQKKYRTEVVAATMLLLDNRPPGTGGGGGGPGPRDDGGFPTDEMEPDDIPF